VCVCVCGWQSERARLRETTQAPAGAPIRRRHITRHCTQPQRDIVRHAGTRDVVLILCSTYARLYSITGLWK